MGWAAWAAATSNPPAGASDHFDGLRRHPASGGRLVSVPIVVAARGLERGRVISAAGGTVSSRGTSTHNRLRGFTASDMIGGTAALRSRAERAESRDRQGPRRVAQLSAPAESYSSRAFRQRTSKLNGLWQTVFHRARQYELKPELPARAAAAGGEEERGPARHQRDPPGWVAGRPRGSSRSRCRGKGAPQRWHSRGRPPHGRSFATRAAKLSPDGDLGPR